MSKKKKSSPAIELSERLRARTRTWRCGITYHRRPAARDLRDAIVKAAVEQHGLPDVTPEELLDLALLAQEYQLSSTAPDNIRHMSTLIRNDKPFAALRVAEKYIEDYDSMLTYTGDYLRNGPVSEADTKTESKKET